MYGIDIMPSSQMRSSARRRKAFQLAWSMADNRTSRTMGVSIRGGIGQSRYYCVGVVFCVVVGRLMVWVLVLVLVFVLASAMRRRASSVAPVRGSTYFS